MNDIWVSEERTGLVNHLKEDKVAQRYIGVGERKPQYFGRWKEPSWKRLTSHEWSEKYEDNQSSDVIRFQ